MKVNFDCCLKIHESPWMIMIILETVMMFLFVHALPSVSPLSVYLICEGFKLFFTT